MMCDGDADPPIMVQPGDINLDQQIAYIEEEINTRAKHWGGMVEANLMSVSEFDYGMASIIAVHRTLIAARNDGFEKHTGTLH